MPTETQTLEADIRGEEKAIRLLLSEEAHLGSLQHRLEAKLKLNEARLSAAQHRAHPAPALPAGPRGSRFPDVSAYQPSVDLEAVRHDAAARCGQMIVTKLTEGTGYVDHYGSGRLATAAQVGFVHRGAYHFGHPSESGTTQAEHFLNNGGHALGAHDVAIFDCEVTDGQSPQAVAICAREFAATVRAHLPCKLWLYGGGPFLKTNGVTLEGFDAHWLAGYVADPWPYVIYGRARTVAWQFTDGVHGPTPHGVAGIGPVDLSIVL